MADLREIRVIKPELQILKEIDDLLNAEKLEEIYEKIICNPSYEAVARESNPAMEIRHPDTVKMFLSIFFDRLKRGILYVYEKFGIVADHFAIDGDSCIGKIDQFPGYTLRYVPELDCITTDYESLAIACTQLMHNRSVSIVPIEYYGKDCLVNIKDAIFLGGVEEAHHAYYIKSKSISSFKAYSTPEEYRSNPIELAAGIVVRQARQEHNIQLYRFIENTD